MAQEGSFQWGDGGRRTSTAGLNVAQYGFLDVQYGVRMRASPESQQADTEAKKGRFSPEVHDLNTYLQMILLARFLFEALCKSDSDDECKAGAQLYRATWRHQRTANVPTIANLVGSFGSWCTSLMKYKQRGEMRMRQKVSTSC